MARILVVDDDPRLRDSLRRALSRLEHEVLEAGTIDEALQALATPVDLLVTDIRLGTGSGLDLIARARRDQLAQRIVAMTGFGSITVAVDAMRLGADDFIEKPFRLDAVSARLTRVLNAVRLEGEVARLQRENECLRDELETDAGSASLIGASAQMQRVRALIARVAASEASVLLQGESGTGKELAARELHRLSSRSTRPFVACDCNTLPEGMIESELFGHEKGAFTSADRRRIGRFELADGGTIFLDEIGELAPAIQVKLLRVLQERAFVRVGGNDTIRVDVRVIAATNRDLAQMTEQGKFRSDLFYRLNVVSIVMPPLRDRLDDIPALVQLFVSRYGQRPDGTRVQLAPETLTALQGHHWPGNVRELENVIHRGCVLCMDDVMTPEDVALELRAGTVPNGPGDLRGALAALERDLIARAVREHHGNLAAAGRALGIERNLLYYKLRKYGFRT
jgi:DNA-binding NtrC family response regulator